MKVMKRNGTEVIFDITKIIAATVSYTHLTLPTT